jgi:hypothetical protein
MDFNAELRQWVDTVANRRVHGTTYEQVLVGWDLDQFAMQPLNGRRPYSSSGSPYTSGPRENTRSSPSECITRRFRWTSTVAATRF